MILLLFIQLAGVHSVFVEPVETRLDERVAACLATQLPAPLSLTRNKAAADVVLRVATAEPPAPPKVPRAPGPEGSITIVLLSVFTL
jgi:hypothetical protein